VSKLTEPLRFERRVLEKVWGGRALAQRPGFALPPDIPVGETWEVVDRADENSVVAEGSFAGRDLHSLMRDFEHDLLGQAPAARNGRFPLLVKYLDASDNLSVQVHPDDEGATRLGLIGGAEAKTEAWYIVDVAPGGVLYAGLKPDVRRAEFARIADGPGVLDALLKWDVRPGDCLLVPGGTVHAIGAGVTILEVQQNSDTTYRLWDWGRVGLDGQPRETHVEKALECIRFGDPARAPVSPEWTSKRDGLQLAHLARSDHFAMNALRIDAQVRLASDSGYRILALIQGTAVLSTAAGEWRMNQGDVWLIPAACGYHHVAPEVPGDALQLVQMLYRA
jgi:mannose-6-phosphate isomerase